MGQTIVHLNCALGVAQIEDFFHVSGFPDRRDIGSIIVEAHLPPSPIPILLVARRIERHVALTVHRATIVPNPNIVASVDQQQMEGFLVAKVGDPRRAVLLVAVHGEHCARRAIARLSRLAQDVERRQDKAIFGGHLQWLPIVAELVHCFGESGILLFV